MTTKKNTPSIRLIVLIFMAFLSVVILFHTSTLLKIPPIWPDEALFSDAASNLIKHGTPGTTLYQGTLPGAEKFGWGYPPLYFYTSAIWLKTFSFSILSQRLLSLFLGLSFLGLFFLVLKNLVDIKLKNKPLLSLALIFLICLSIDQAFTKAIHIARPEIEVLFLSFISFYFLLKSLKRPRKIFSLLSGVFLSLAFLTHYLAIIFLLSFLIYFLILNPRSFYKDKHLYIFLLAFFTPITIWLFSIFQDLNYLLNDVFLRLKYKTTSPYWIWIVFSSSPLIIKIQYIIFFIISWEVILSSWFIKYRKGILISLLLIMSWIWTYLWQTEYSFIYTVIFCYLALIYLIYSYLALKKNTFQTKFRIFIALGLILTSINLWSQASDWKTFSGANYDYSLYAEEILEIIPDNTTVYLSAIPEPYYAFQGRHNKLFQYPGLPTEKDNLVDILNQTDYIVFNSPLEKIVVGDVVSPYIEANAEAITPIGSSLQYQVFVIKLKPYSSRTY